MGTMRLNDVVAEIVGDVIAGRAINKDTAELHHELVPFNAELAQRMSDRAVRILSATDAGELLPRIARDRDHFECRMCAWQDRCLRAAAWNTTSGLRVVKMCLMVSASRISARTVCGVFNNARP